MALTLGVKIGDVVDVAQHWLALLSIDNRDCATLITNGGQKVMVTTGDMVEMIPEVWVGLAPRPPRSKLRLVFDAPRHMIITRRVEEDDQS